MSTPFNPFQSGAPATPPSGPVGSTSPAASSLPLQVARPPIVLLAVAAGAAVVGLIFATIGWGNWIALVGWVFAGPVAIGSMGAFIGADTRRRAEPVYVRPSWIAAGYVAVAAVAAIGIGVSAIGFALWMGRQ